eukprot:357260-Chlamydomonas_euryale.AAC.5
MKKRAARLSYQPHELPTAELSGQGQPSLQQHAAVEHITPLYSSSLLKVFIIPVEGRSTGSLCAAVHVALGFQAHPCRADTRVGPPAAAHSCCAKCRCGLACSGTLLLRKWQCGLACSGTLLLRKCRCGLACSGTSCCANAGVGLPAAAQAVRKCRCGLAYSGTLLLRKFRRGLACIGTLLLRKCQCGLTYSGTSCCANAAVGSPTAAQAVAQMPVWACLQRHIPVAQMP